MNKLFLVILTLVTAQSALAIECTSEGWEEATPIVTLSAEPIYKDGQLVALNRLSISYVGPQDPNEDLKYTEVSTKIIWVDAKYRPRKNKDSVRFNIDEISTMEWANKNYGGIIHSLIFPKTEGKTAGSFNAILTASDDVYHDQIHGYYKFICE